MDANLYPKISEDTSDETFKKVVLNKNEFSKAIKQVIFAVSIQETQAVLTGVCFNIENNINDVNAHPNNISNSFMSFGICNILLENNL